MEARVCAAIRLAVPALEGDVAEYMASSVVVASEDLDEPQPISSDRVASLIAPFLEDEGLDKSALSALSGAIAQLFVPAAEPEPEACPGHDDTLQQSSPQQNVQSARDSRVQKLAASNGHGRASAEGRRRSQSRGRGRSRGRGASNGHPIADLPARVAAEAAPEPEPEQLEAISAEDQQQQQEEAELLESILGTGAFHRCGQHEWEIDVEVACPASVTVEWLAGMGENQATNSFVVEHLPPLTLGIERSPGYPSRNPPQFTLRCHWLGYEELSKLAGALDELWESAGGAGDPVLYSWVDFLKDEGWSAAGLSGSSEGESERARLHLGGVEAAIPVGGSDGRRGDLRVMPMLQLAIRNASARAATDSDDHSDGQGNSTQRAAANALEQCVMEMMRFNTFAAARAFDEASHTCEVCYDDKPGTLFTRVHCGHSFCSECLGGMATVHITDGSLEMLRCPEMDCSAQLEMEELRQLVDISAFERWERLTLQKTLDAMTDLVYCPRCEAPVLEEGGGDHFGQCASCELAFCTLCREAFHPGMQCMEPEERLKVLGERARGNKNAGKAERERHERLLQEAMSLSQLKKTSKKCPRCSMGIEKNGGCNKMTCGNCGCFFCWRCNRAVDGYDHFGSGSCVLFEQAEITAWERQQGYHAIGRQNIRDRARALFDVGGAGGVLVVRSCPGCRQRIPKDGRSNHMVCWNCMNGFCFDCGKAIPKGKGAVAKHYMPPSPCKQHS